MGGARGEFKRHKDADPRFLKQFIQEWSKYRDQLRDMSSRVRCGLFHAEDWARPRLTPRAWQPGRALSEEEVNALSPEQKEQLSRLHNAAKDLHRDG